MKPYNGNPNIHPLTSLWLRSSYLPSCRKRCWIRLSSFYPILQNHTKQNSKRVYAFEVVFLTLYRLWFVVIDNSMMMMMMMIMLKIIMMMIPIKKISKRRLIRKIMYFDSSKMKIASLHHHWVHWPWSRFSGRKEMEFWIHCYFFGACCIKMCGSTVVLKRDSDGDLHSTGTFHVHDRVMSGGLCPWGGG
jgi:hypothetical protein